MGNEHLLSLEGIAKQFPGVRALDGVDLHVRKGTVHALMGENGAGKSTLMNCLIGICRPDAGTMKFKGAPLSVPDPHVALAKGISMIHQELNPIPHMTVAENIFLGREPPTRWGLVDAKELNRRAAQLLSRLEVQLDPAEELARLSVAQQQLVEIARAISYDADLIVMDEPTSALTDTEVHGLFRIIDSLRASGKSIVYITHKIDEVFRISDEVTVLRDGRNVGTDAIGALTEGMLVRRMVGRTLREMFRKDPSSAGETVLEVRNLSGTRFRNVSFRVGRGEILGIAGLMGAGRTEVLEAVFGLNRPSAGEILVNGVKLEVRSPAVAIRHGLALLTEDRKLTGVFPNATAGENMAIANLGQYPRGPLLDFRRIDSDCERICGQLKIKTSGLRQSLTSLSGGNQQKVLIARWLLTGSSILLLDEPTRGIDVGAKSEIYRLMAELVGKGKSIVMVSSELPEILGMSDRILVMHEGEKVGELKREDATQERILHLATGLPLPADPDARRGEL